MRIPSLSDDATKALRPKGERPAIWQETDENLSRPVWHRRSLPFAFPESRKSSSNQYASSEVPLKESMLLTDRALRQQVLVEVAASFLEELLPKEKPPADLVNFSFAKVAFDTVYFKCHFGVALLLIFYRSNNGGSSVAHSN